MKVVSNMTTVGLAAIGMILGHWIAGHVEMALNSAKAASGSLTQDTLKARKFILVDDKNHSRIVMGQAKEGPPGMWFFDHNGKARLVLGTYEDGGPSVVLNDAQENAVEIFRTVGPKSSPVLVFKADHTDRMIFGLSERTSDPYLVYYDSKGGSHPQFGSR